MEGLQHLPRGEGYHLVSLAQKYICDRLLRLLPTLHATEQLGCRMKLLQIVLEFSCKINSLHFPQ